MADTTMNIPEALPLSPKVKALRKAWQESEDKLTAYRQENARYAPRKSVNALYETTYTYPALTEAKRELAEQEVQAVAAGKPLPSRDSILKPVQAKVDEYPRMVQALKSLAETAYAEFVAAVKADMVSMGLKEAAKAAACLDQYQKAYRAMETARAALEHHAGLFTWCISEGDMDTVPRTGHSQGDHLEHWSLNDQGQLTWESAQEMDFLEWLVKVPGLIAENPHPVVQEEVNLNHKPQVFNAGRTDAYGRPVGSYSNGWEY